MRSHLSWSVAAIGAPVSTVLAIVACLHLGAALEQLPLAYNLMPLLIPLAGTLLGFGCARAFGQDSFRSVAFGAVFGCVVGWLGFAFSMVWGLSMIGAVFVWTPVWVLYGLPVRLGYRLARA